MAEFGTYFFPWTLFRSLNFRKELVQEKKAGVATKVQEYEPVSGRAVCVFFLYFFLDQKWIFKKKPRK